MKKKALFPLAFGAAAVASDVALSQTISNLYSKSGLQADKFIKLLDLPDNINPSNADTLFASQRYPNQYPQIKIVSEQLDTVIDSFVNLAEGAGASKFEAKTAVEQGIIDALEKKKLDLSKASDLNLIKKEITEEVSKLENIDMDVFKSLSNDTVKAIKNINEKFSNIEDIYSSEAKSTFSVSNQLPNQISKAVDAEKLEAGSGTIDFVDASALESASNVSYSFGSAYMGALPLAAIGLTGSGGVQSEISAQASFTQQGYVGKGPLENATVFLDYDDDGVKDTNEPSVRTDSNGFFTITGSQSNYSIVAITDGSTLDSSSGNVLDGVILKADKSSTMVSPTTTLIKDSGLTANQIKSILGLPDNFDPNIFNPYAAGSDTTLALSVEKANHMIVNTINTFSGALEGSGASATNAFKASLESFIDVITDKHTSSSTLDLNSSSELDLIKAKLQAMSITGVDTTSFNSMVADTVTAVKNVNDKINSVSDLTSTTSKNIFSTPAVLKDQVKTAVENEKTTPGNGNISFKNSTAVDTAASNTAPTDIALSSTSLNEDASSLVVGTLSTTDSDQSSGTAHTYSIVAISGTDYDSFSLNQNTGQISFKNQPSYESKNTYTLSIQSKDEGGKIFVKSFEITIVNGSDPTIANAISDQSATEGFSFSYTFNSNTFADADSGDTLTYSATRSDGTSLPTWLVFAAATRTFSGTPANADVGNIAIKVTATDRSGDSVSDNFVLTVASNSAPTVANAIPNQSATEDVSFSYTFNTNTFNDADTSDSLTYSATLSDGSSLPSWLTFYANSGTFSGTPTNDNVGTITVKVTATDTNSASVSETFNIVVANVNDAPSNFALSSTGVAENSSGATVGTLSATDVDVGDTLTYTLGSGGDNDFFEIDGTTLKLKSSNTADYETKNTYDITINVSDGTASSTLSKTITITNVNESVSGSNSDKGSASLSTSLNPGTPAEYIVQGSQWSATGIGADLKYSFGVQQYYSSDYDYDGATNDNDITDYIYTPTTAFKNAVASNLSLWSNVSLLNFTEIEETSDTTIGQLRFASYDNSTARDIYGATISSSFAYYPAFSGSSNADHFASGDIFYGGGSSDQANIASNYTNYSYYNYLINHEIGHALGLKHPHDVLNGYASDSSGTTMPDTVLSYAQYDGGTTSPSYSLSDAFPTTLMVTDIAALHYLYGVNNQYNTGDTTYTLSSFSSNFNFIYASIWDAGGEDTFSWYDQSTAANIDLAAGSYSFFGDISSQSDSDLAGSLSAGDGLLGIAYNCVIENAKGGTASDTIAGNSSANKIYGGTGSGIKDTLTGNAGADIFVCDIDDAVTALASTDLVTDFTDGTDKIGLKDITVSDLSWNTISGGTYDGDTQIYQTSTNKVLILLDGIDSNLISTDDFTTTDFV